MPKYVAFLRAINVGGHVVKMDRLRELFAALGFANVETFIASGNVIFDSKSKNTQALERKIEKQLQEALGYAVATFVRTTTEVAELAMHQPFPGSEIEGHYIGFLSETLDASTTKKLLACSGEVDEFNVAGREIYWQLRTKFIDSKFSGSLLEKTLGTRTTLRNANTIKRIAARYS
jgi:uncharacterized protein (DUF1697 family)